MKVLWVDESELHHDDDRVHGSSILTCSLSAKEYVFLKGYNAVVCEVVAIVTP